MFSAPGRPGPAAGGPGSGSRRAMAWTRDRRCHVGSPQWGPLGSGRRAAGPGPLAESEFKFVGLGPETVTSAGRRGRRQ